MAYTGTPEQENFINRIVAAIKADVLCAVVLQRPFHDGGEVPTTALADFSELHDFCDANTLGGQCDEEVITEGNEVFGFRADEDADDSLMSESAMEAYNMIQNRVSEWISCGAMASDAADLAEVLQAIDAQPPRHGDYWSEPLACLLDPSRREEAAAMLEDWHQRAGMPRAAVQRLMGAAVLIAGL